MDKISKRMGLEARERLRLGFVPTDAITVTSVTQFGFMDIIRIVLGMAVRIRTTVWLEKEPGRHAVENSVQADRVFAVESTQERSQ